MAHLNLHLPNIINPTYT